MTQPAFSGLPVGSSVPRLRDGAAAARQPYHPEMIYGYRSIRTRPCPARGAPDGSRGGWARHQFQLHGWL